MGLGDLPTVHSGWGCLVVSIVVKDVVKNGMFWLTMILVVAFVLQFLSSFLVVPKVS